MKSILFSVLFLFIPKLAISQVITANDDAVYIDSLYNMGNEKNYKYIRVIKDYYSPNQKSFEVKDYYKSGKIAMSGTTTTREKITKNGMFVYYYENDNKKTICNFIKNEAVGKRYNFYKNGNKKEEGEHIWDKKNKISRYMVQQNWDSIGTQKVFDGNGELENIGQKTYSTGKIKNGFRDGVWIGYDKNIGYTFTETYENQKLVSGVSIDKDKTLHNYNVVELPPRAKNFLSYIANNYKTPNIPSGIKGTIYVAFTVETDGEIANIKILKDLGYGTGLEAIRVLKSYGNWIPGEQRGIKVRCSYSLPIAIQSPN